MFPKPGSRQSKAKLNLALLPFLLAVAVTAVAQDSVTGGSPVLPSKPQPDPTDDQTTRIRVTSPIVTTPVVVIDRGGQYVYDLQQKDFTVLDDDAPQKILQVEPAINPVAAVLVIQTSKSTAPLLDQVEPIGSLFSGLLLGEKGEAAVIFYSDRVQVAQDFSNDSAQLKKTLNFMVPNGSGQRLNDALARAINMLAQRPSGQRRVVVVFSDTSDHGSSTKTDEVVRLALNNGVAIYGLGFNAAESLLKKKPEYQQPDAATRAGARPSPPGVVATETVQSQIYNYPISPGPILEGAGETVRSTLLHNKLEAYAGYTGGLFYSHWSGTKLQDQIGQIAQEIQSEYELSYVPNTLDRTGFHSIEVQVNRPEVKVRTRTGYYVGEKKQ